MGAPGVGGDMFLCLQLVIFSNELGYGYSSLQLF